MKPFDELTPLGQTRRLRSRAAEVLDRYGMRNASLTFLNRARQTNFKVEAHGPGRKRTKKETFLLRIHWPETLKPVFVRSEFSWLRALRKDTDLVVPEPVADREGKDVVPMDVGPGSKPVLCSVTRWLAGRPYLRRFGPGPEALRQVGRMMARLHLHGRAWKRPPLFRRPRWDWEGVLGPSAYFHPDAGGGILDREARNLFEKASGRVRDAMTKLGTGPEVFGLIHGDLIQVNYLFHEGKILAIDFADCGTGHFLYDMGITLFALWGRDERNRQREAFLEGYRALRPISPAHERMLNLFLAARGVATARYVMGSDDPRDQEIAHRYAAYVVKGLKVWLG
ncbi:MAG: phosphotransferase enzyme family protein [Planctomycetota bacterium]|jgi:Ser/Thr protein kinase RdoA (MazF antagonist)